MKRGILSARWLLLMTAFATVAQAQGTYDFQPELDARVSKILHHDELRFKDLNKNGKLDVYEDWRAPVDNRVVDLLSQMTLQEKAGMLMISTLNAEARGTLSDQAVRYVEDEKMTRFIFRNTVTATPAPPSANRFRGVEVSPNPMCWMRPVD